MIKLLAIILFTIAFNVNAVEHKVLAIVNEKIITDIDLNKRVKLIIRSTGMEDNQESFNLIKGQALQTMIDEKLIASEAALFGISVEQEEIDEALASLADKNGLKASEFPAFLKKTGINRQTLLEQLSHQLLWNKIVRTVLQPKISITSQEVDENAKTIKAIIQNSTFDVSEQVKLSEIVIFMDSKKQAEEKMKLAKKIVNKIKAGTPFEEMVSQFSQAVSASNKGHLGWIYLVQLMPELQDVLKVVEIGGISQAILMGDGIHILKVNDRKSKVNKKSIELDNKQIEDILFQRKFEVLVRTHLTQMRSRAYIKINAKIN